MTTERVHEKSPTDGRLVLYGKDDVGVHFHSYQLKAHSGFFRVMLETKSYTASVKMPDLTSEHLLDMRTAMDTGHIPHPTGSLYTFDRTFFDACEKYEMHGIALIKIRSLASGLSCAIMHVDYRTELFFFAAKLACVDVSARILACEQYAC